MPTVTKTQRVLGAAMLFACSFAPGLARAEGETKFEIDLRTGYGIPIGKAAGGATHDMSELTAGQIPLWLDLGARIGQRVFVGGYASYGIGILSGDVSDACEQADDLATEAGGSSRCSASDVRLGLQGVYHFGAPHETHAWIGAGIGYEWWSFSQSIELGGQSASLSLTAHGFEFFNLQVGADLPLSGSVAMGPFLTFSLAQFQTVSSSCSGDCGDIPDDSESIDDKSIHSWFFLGVRGAFLP